ncbi:MAG TPA: 3-oxo-tetronate kinase [Chthoniobacterales bacterium]|nr:3-oxo-tetronate kinase [Chthoniobacterales bacterium]
MPLLGCIADDFTGGTDLASNLVKSGFRVVQTIGVPEAFRSLDEVDAVVAALKTRTSSVEFAVSESRKALERLRSVGCRQFYFKYCSTFDSTPQGNIGSVIEVLLRELNEAFTIASPAFTDNGRTVYHGHLFVYDQLLNESGMERHPLTPMTDPNIVRVLAAQTSLSVGLVRSQTIRQGETAVEAAFEMLQSQGIGIAVTDATSNDDLVILARAANGMKLVTGGSGLALGLGENFALRDRPASIFTAPPGRRAILAGSCSQMTLKQIDRAKDHFPSFRVEPRKLRSDFEATFEEVLRWMRDNSSSPVLVYTSAAPDELVSAQKQIGIEQAGILCEKFLASLAARLANDGYSQFIVAGGETSGAVVKQLAVDFLQIGPEIAPGVPWTVAFGAKRKIALALKSGNFGSEQFFIEAWQLLDAGI